MYLSGNYTSFSTPSLLTAIFSVEFLDYLLILLTSEITQHKRATDQPEIEWASL